MAHILIKIWISPFQTKFNLKSVMGQDTYSLVGEGVLLAKALSAPFSNPKRANPSCFFCFRYLVRLVSKTSYGSGYFKVSLENMWM